MAKPGIATEAVAVVVRGVFNPNEISPAWLRENDLVGPIEVEKQNVEFRTADIIVFQMGWVRVHVQRDLLQFSTDVVEEYLRLRDLCLGVLRLLDEAPVSALGVNREFHTQIGSWDQWHAIGDTITPKDIWNDVLIAPGMRATTLLSARPDGYSGSVQVQIEPSIREREAVYVGINDHYDLSPEGKSISPRNTPWGIPAELEPTAEKRTIAIGVLLNQWNEIFSRADAINTRATSLGKK